MTGRQLAAWGIAAVAGALAPALLFTLVLAVQARGGAGLLWVSFSLALWVGLAHTVPLGIPAAWWLHRRGRLRLGPVVIAGALIGAVGNALWNWPVRFGATRASVWIDGTQTLSEGMPTAAGWLIYGEGVLVFALLGAVGGAAFLAAWRFTRQLGPDTH